MHARHHDDHARATVSVRRDTASSAKFSYTVPYMHLAIPPNTCYGPHVPHIVCLPLSHSCTYPPIYYLARTDYKFLCMPRFPVGRWAKDYPPPPFYPHNEALALIVALVMGLQHGESGNLLAAGFVQMM